MKKFKAFVLVISILVVTALCTSCASAYDVAVKNGFSGNEQQWLNSLKGKDGADGSDLSIEQIYSYALDNGFSGTYLDFLDEYLSFEVGKSNEEAVSKGLRSAVEVYCSFVGTGYLSSEYTQGGAGVIYKMNKEAKTAYIITNYHVVYSSKSSNNISSDIKIIPYGQEAFVPASFVGGTPTYDIAVLKVDGFDAEEFYRAVTVNKSDVTVGQTAIAIGNPSGSGISATQGIVSVDSEQITMSAIDNPQDEVKMRVMRIDTAVNSGNSGGGLYNDRGELIGIVNAKSGDKDIENMGYAIPASVAAAVADNIISNGAFIRGFAGVQVASKDARAYLDGDIVHIKETVVVDSVSGAAYGILQKNDVILAVKTDSEEIEANRSFNIVDALLSCSPGDEVTFTVLRGGEELTLKVILQK